MTATMTKSDRLKADQVLVERIKKVWEKRAVPDVRVGVEEVEHNGITVPVITSNIASLKYNPKTRSYYF